jgi:hypothetical protein
MKNKKLTMRIMAAVMVAMMVFGVVAGTLIYFIQQGHIH